MHLLIISALLAACAASPQATIDESLIAEIFGTAPTPVVSGPATERLEDITVAPTESPSTHTDPSTGSSCKCVPYYLCNGSKVAVDIEDPAQTGYGVIDIRFKDEDEKPRTCKQSLELCCTMPKSPEEVPQPQPDPSRLKGCGYSNPKGLDFSIVGGNGNEAQFGEYPWVVALLTANNSTYIGVGVLLHPQVVLTAAHVVYKYPLRTLKIRAGEWDTQTITERLPHQERIVSDMHINEGFSDKSLRNDMALLRLAEPVQLSDHINVICMPQQGQKFENSKNCIANGWGRKNFGQEGRYAVILKKVSIDMVPHERCGALLRQTRLGNRFRLHESFVCAGGVEGKDTCQGDGGAPLVCPIGDNRYTLTGLVAWGIGCGAKDVPAVYAAVANFRQWVDETLVRWGVETEYDV